MSRPDYAYYIARRDELAAKVARMAGKSGVNVARGHLRETVLMLRTIEIQEAK